MRNVMGSAAAARPDRRRFLLTGLGVVGGAVLAAGSMSGTGFAAAGPAAKTEKTWKGKTGANGWQVLSSAPVHRVEGTGGVQFSAVAGDVATVLTHVVRRFHYEIDALRDGEVTGHTANREVAAPYESNHLSGTAIAIRPLRYPLGARDGLFPHELVVVRDILADLEGVVQWGGDSTPAKESHFGIAVRPGDARLRQVASKIRGWDATPGVGAGATDALAPGRLKAAKALAAGRS
ncbi:hypothetical protein ACFWIB_12105 [Streptomyces sp. NPDC127051]|uniref:hypothetical protein n=1 Tax=Streptomyces sp. NPDC127051 TaxID=3347119 RepID=UPI00364929E1